MNNPFQLPELFTLSGVKVTSADALNSNIVVAACTSGGCSSGGTLDGVD